MIPMKLVKDFQKEEIENRKARWFLLNQWGFNEKDIMDIRKILTDEIKRQNESSRINNLRIAKVATLS